MWQRMIPEQMPAPVPPSVRPDHPFRRRGLAAMLSMVIICSAGVVLAQVLQQPVAAPIAAAIPAAPLKLDTVTAQRGDIQDTVGAAGKLQLYKYADAYAQIA